MSEAHSVNPRIVPRGAGKSASLVYQAMNLSDRLYVTRSKSSASH